MCKVQLKLIILMGFLIMATIEQAQAFIVYDPTNWLQNSMTAANSAQILVQETQSLQVALADIKNYDGNVGQWANIQHELEQLGNTIQQGSALSYQMQNLDAAFQSKFPGFKPNQNYSTEYQNWSKTALDTLRGTLDSVGLQSSQFATEQSRLNTLKQLSQSATGRMQAAQVGNMIATEQVAETQSLRQLVMTQVNAENTYAASQLQKDASSEASVAQWISNGDTHFPEYGQHSKNQ